MISQTLHLSRVAMLRSRATAPNRVNTPLSSRLMDKPRPTSNTSNTRHNMAAILHNNRASGHHLGSIQIKATVLRRARTVSRPSTSTAAGPLRNPMASSREAGAPDPQNRPHPATARRCRRKSTSPAQRTSCAAP